MPGTVPKINIWMYTVDTVDGKNPATVDMVNILLFIIIYRVSYMSGRAGFLPSTVWMDYMHIA